MSDPAFLEKFVLAADRKALLKELVPDSRDFHFYTALYYQTLACENVNLSAGDAKVGKDPNLELAAKHISANPLYSDDQNALAVRQKLLSYPSATESEQKEIMEDLRYRLGFAYNHTKRVERFDAPKPNYPTRLPEVGVVDLKTVLTNAYRSTNDSLTYFTPLANDWLATQDMDRYKLRSFLQKFHAPNVPGLIAWIVKDMKNNDTSFGNMSIHNQLTAEQLKELEKALPAVASNTNYALAVLRKTQPDKPIAELDAKAKATFYADTWEYALKLPALFNSIKSSLMHHCLIYGRDTGSFDFDKFMKWLDLPRNNYPYSNRFSGPEYKSITIHWCSSVHAGVLPPLYNEEGIARDYLSAYFRGADVTTTDKFAKYFDKDYLLNLLAETKILLNGAGYGKSGDGKAEQKSGTSAAMEVHFNRLGSGTVANLKARVDLEFDPNNNKQWTAGDDVKLSVYVKNVPTLIVKLFKINARSFYRQNLREVDASINLDGLTPWEESTKQYDDVDSYQRVRRVLEFPKLKGLRGVFVVELLGNGKFSRAVIRQGSLSFLEHQSPNGHVFRLLNEASQPVNGSIFINGQTYTSDEKTGLILAPYAASTTSGAVILLTDEKEFTALSRFTHASENYSFAAAMYIDRESLLSKSQSDLLIRPTLYLNSRPIQLTAAILKKCILRINTTNDEGVASSQVLNDFKLVTDGKDTVHAFTVPENLRRVEFNLEVEVRVASQGSTRSLSSSVTYALNSIDDTERIDDLHLRYAADGYSVYLLGKSGEARPHIRVSFTFYHSHVTNSLSVDLQSDERGRVLLGPLPHITRMIAVAEHGGARGDWNLESDFNTPRSLIHAVEGDEVIRIPYHGKADAVTSAFFSLFEIRHNTFQADVLTKYLRLLSAERSLQLSGLPAGEYQLMLKETGATTTIRVGRGEVVLGTYVMEPNRFIELRSRDVASLQIAKVSEDSKNVTVQVSQYSPAVRVHVFSSHFYPEYSLTEQINRNRSVDPYVYPINRLSSTYYGSKDLGDEQQYILDRKLAKKYTGNMLPRPSLLLNERMRQLTTFDADPTLRSGDAFGVDAGSISAGSAYPCAPPPAIQDMRKPSPLSSSATRNLEFLSDPSSRVLNAVPDSKTGVVTIPRSSFGAHHTHLLVVAIDGNTTSVIRRIPLTPTAPAAAVDAKADMVLDPAYVDTRLLPGLSPSKHFTEQHMISVLQTGDAKQVDDIRTATVETYETLGDVWSLYNTLAKSKSSSLVDTLAKFQFVMEWPTLSDDKKAEKYSEYSCHELNFFLYSKDRPFFTAVVKPFIKDKLAKTFLDRWLLNMDVSMYVARPFEFMKLNAFEKILLAAALPAQTAFVTQFVIDQAALLAKNPQEFIALFKTALQSRALDSAEKGAGSSVPKKNREAERADKQMLMQERELERPPQIQAQQQQRQAFAAAASASASAAFAPSMPMPRMAMGAPAPKASMKKEAASSRSRRSAARDMDCDDAEPEMERADIGGSADGLAAKLSDDPWAASGSIAPARRLFAAPPTTKEVEERNYYEVPSDSTDAASRLITNNQFWSDYAVFVSKQAEEKKAGPFLSQYIAYAAGNFTEIMCALAVIDLPYKAGKHDVQAGRVLFKFKAATPTLLFHREVKETPIVPSSISVTQTYFDPSDPTEEVDGERVDKYVSKEFLPGRVYGCRTVLTNVSSTHQNLAVLKQIPAGSVPVTKYGRNGMCRGFITRTDFTAVQPFSTFVLEFFFYFPSLGTYDHYPVHISKTGKDGTNVIGCGAPFVVHVVGKPTTPPDLTSWKYLSQNGTEEQVLAYMKNQNLYKVDVSEVAWRYRESPKFYKAASALLRQRLVRNPVLASYAIHYNDPVGVRDVLPHYDSQILYRVGPYFRSTLLNVDAADYPYNSYQHFEYTPLINARAHQLKSSGGRSGPAGLKATEIQNVQFRAQYARFLKYLLYRSSGRAGTSLGAQLAATYYLLLQDRNDEAVQYFASIDMKRAASGDSKSSSSAAAAAAPIDPELQMQYDYLSAYLDFFAPAGPTVALSIAKKYANYPVAKKRALFKEIADQIFEASPNAKVDLEVGKEGESRDREMANLAATEPAIDLLVDSGKIDINYANVPTATLNFYVMDLELLFSTNPFLNNSKEAKFLFVSPNFSQELKLPKDKTAFTCPIPSQFNNANIFVEVVGPGQGLTRVQAYYSNSVRVQLIENYGQVKVIDKTTQRPLPKTYVKVYAKEKTGGTNFYKDGYTDSRGRFDYASLSTSKLPNVERFSILLMTEGNGAVVREASPPAS